MVVAWVVLPVMAQILQMRIFHDVTGGIYGSPPLLTGTQTYINESSTTLARTTLARGSWPTHRPIELLQPYGCCITVIAGGILLKNPDNFQQSSLYLKIFASFNVDLSNKRQNTRQALKCLSNILKFAIKSNGT